MADIGKNIKFYRTLSDMTLEELGDRVGVQKQTIQKYESGQIANIPQQRIQKIADVFKVETTDLTNEDALEVFNQIKRKLKSRNHFSPALSRSHKNTRHPKVNVAVKRVVSVIDENGVSHELKKKR